MRIGIAQIESRTGDIAWNIEHHLKVLRRLKMGEVDLVMFPELSLSNYEPDIAESVAIDSDDSCLDVFQKFADESGISLGVGIPTKSAKKPYISIIAFVPNRDRTVINKLYLHSDETAFFSAATGGVSVLTLEERVAIAICYEVHVDAHIESAVAEGMDIYLASVAKTKDGIDKAKARLCTKSKQFRIPILMANSVGTCEGKEAGGGSSVVCGGEILASLGNDVEALLVYDSVSQSTLTVPLENL